jgi:hypothetical protein
MAIILVTGPTSEPVSLAEAKLQNGMPPGDDSDHVKSQQVGTRLRRAIRSARVLCENYTRRAFLTQTWLLKLDGWPFHDPRYAGGHHPFSSGPIDGGYRYHKIVLPKPPYQSITTFTYVDIEGNTQNMSDWGAYQVDPGSETQPARVLPPYLQPWPPVRMIPNNVQIELVCGYGDAGSTVPQNILDAILLAQQYLYDGDPLKNGLPKIVTDLLEPYRNLVA